MCIENIRYHINEGKTDREISKMYNISDMEAIKILRNSSDNKDLFYYLVFRLGIAENWENLASEAIQEIEKRKKRKLKIEGKARVYKQFPEKECEVKKAVVSFGISWINVIFYDHSNKLCFNYSDCYKKIPSDLINEFICTNVLPEGINVVNEDKGH